MKRSSHFATLFLLFALGFAFTTGCKGHPEPAVSGDGTTYENKTDKPWSFRLPDSSRVVLSPHSLVRIPKSFATKREAELDGEALFEIIGGEEFDSLGRLIREVDTLLQPFMLHTRHLDIEAWRSRFHADAYRSMAGEEIDLLEGKLRVQKSYHSTSDNEPEFLYGGDMVMINRDIDLMEKEKMDSAELARTKAMRWP